MQKINLTPAAVTGPVPAAYGTSNPVTGPVPATLDDMSSLFSNSILRLKKNVNDEKYDEKYDTRIMVRINKNSI